MDKTLIGTNVRMDAELRATLQAWADSEGITVSQLVRRLLAVSAAKWTEAQNSDEQDTGSQARLAGGHSVPAK